MRAPTARARRAIAEFGEGLFSRFARPSELREHFASFRHVRITLGLGYVAASRVQAWARIPEPTEAERSDRERSAALASCLLALEETRLAGAIVGWSVVSGPKKCIAQMIGVTGGVVHGEGPHILAALGVAIDQLRNHMRPAGSA